LITNKQTLKKKICYHKIIMLKIIKTLFLVGIIFVIFYIVISIYLVKFDSTSPLGQNLRKSIIKYPFLVSFINLNQPGDNRYAYVSAHNPTISVKVFYTPNVIPDTDISTWITNMMTETVGKKIDLEMLPLTEAEALSYSDQDLNLIRKNNESEKFNNPVLNIYYLTSYAEKPSYLGLTLHRDTIFIFKQTMLDISEKLEITKRLEQSTVSHEWGHLLDLPHIEELGCVMSNYLETYENWPMKESMIPLTHCWSTLYALDKLKASAR